MHSQETKGSSVSKPARILRVQIHIAIVQPPVVEGARRMGQVMAVVAQPAGAQGQLAKDGVLIHQIDEEPAYDIYVLRSFAEFLWLWLEDTARESGMVVLGG